MALERIKKEIELYDFKKTINQIENEKNIELRRGLFNNFKKYIYNMEDNVSTLTFLRNLAPEIQKMSVAKYENLEDFIAYVNLKIIQLTIIGIRKNIEDSTDFTQILRLKAMIDKMAESPGKYPIGIVKDLRQQLDGKATELSLQNLHLHKFGSRKSVRKSTRKSTRKTKITRKSTRKSTRKTKITRKSVRKSTRKSTRKVKSVRKSTRKVKKSARKTVQRV